ncbi:MAG: hypothetical protein ACRD4S_13340 [Candidatus Acidiferrales bacterium]
MKSPILTPGARKTIERKILNVLNQQKDFLSVVTAGSTRATGDAIQSIIEEQFEAILGDLGGEYSAKFARRAMADLAFKDKHGNYYVVDVKTHREETVFNMPNLTSVDRLARFYEDDMNFFIVLMVRYGVTGTKVKVTKVHFVPIENLSWSCLTIGALGIGQIQIANARNITIDLEKTRRSWMLDLCETILQFYPREIIKIGKRVAKFEKVREFWLAKEDT